MEWVTSAVPGHVCRAVARSVVGLMIPADVSRRLVVGALPLSGLGAAVGGGLVDDGLRGALDGAGYVFYLDRHRVTKGLPPNQRAAVLAARLGHTDRGWLAGLWGDVLVLGCRGQVEDVSVPRCVDAARRSALTVVDGGDAAGVGR